jgi:hypothetical protein
MFPHRSRVTAILRRLVPIASVCVVAALGLTPGAHAATEPTSPAACGSGWQLVRSPNPRENHDFFNGVAAVAPDDVWAVGGRDELSRDHPHDHTLIEHWDGTRWSIVKSPNASGASRLDAIAAVGPDDIWAVGQGGSGVLTEHWDGTSWSIVPAPFRGDLTGVTAISSEDVVAVGLRFGASVEKPFALRWTGSGWVRVPVQTDGKPNPIEFRAVSAADASHIWAVGLAQRPNYIWTLAEFSAGSGFTMVRTPTPKRGFDRLSGVTAIARNDVWAVGDSIPRSFPAKSTHNVAMHWDGSAWTLVPAPTRRFAHFDQVDTQLAGVDAVTSTEVWAVGSSEGIRNGGRRSTRRRTLTLKWQGQRWSVVASPNAFDIRNSELRAVSALPDGHVWAVGAANSSTGKAESTLVLERC